MEAECTDCHDLFRRYRATLDPELRNELVLAYQPLVERSARRFARRGEPHADLVQVAQIGLLKAVERYDPDHGAEFSAFATPTILGELRRYFRDATWALRVPRGRKDAALRLNQVLEDLEQRLGRSPAVHEVASEMRVSVDDVLETMEARNAYRTWEQPTSSDASRFVAAADRGLDAMGDRVATLRALDGLDRRRRSIVFLRYFCDLTQQEIATQLGVSQVHVSRLLRSALADLRSSMATAA